MARQRTTRGRTPVGLRARIRYRFDNAISRGTSVVMLWLGLLTLAVVALAAVALTFLHLTGVGGEDEEAIPPPSETVGTYGGVVGFIAAAAIGIGVFLFVISPLLNRLMALDAGTEARKA